MHTKDAKDETLNISTKPLLTNVFDMHISTICDFMEFHRIHKIVMWQEHPPYTMSHRLI